VNVSALDYALPPELVAVHPVTPRDAARMFVFHRRERRIEHRRILDLPEYLQAGDQVIFNRTRVIPALLRARKSGSGGAVEGLFLHARGERDWVLMLRSNRPLRTGQVLDLLDLKGDPSGHRLCLSEKLGDRWIAVLEGAGSAAEILHAIGRTPLPPYIRAARMREGAEEVQPRDAADYQTLFSEFGAESSVAAPTAGLHFTTRLLDAIDRRGAARLEIELAVGPGTFRPIETERIADHPMHEESVTVPAAVALALRGARPFGSKRLAVGTTVVRTLESLPDPVPATEWRAQTSLLIAPPFDFRFVDALLTNFHLPRSTLLALVAALVGLDQLHALYAEAIAERYRFYSYGDAMLILP